MKLSTKGRYAMIALTDIAREADGGLTTFGGNFGEAGHIAGLSRAVVCEAEARGYRGICARAGGGYRLARDPAHIRVAEVLGAVDETMDALTRGAGASGADQGPRRKS